MLLPSIKHLDGSLGRGCSVGVRCHRAAVSSVPAALGNCPAYLGTHFEAVARRAAIDGATSRRLKRPIDITPQCVGHGERGRKQATAHPGPPSTDVGQ